MKKSFIISSLLLGLTLASCQKEVILPNQDTQQENTTRLLKSTNDGSSYDNTINKGTVLNPDFNLPNGSNPITDPNNDPDINKRRIK